MTVLMRRASIATALNYKAPFESVPGQYLILSTDFNIIAVSNAYLRATMTRRENMVGHHLFEVFPDNPLDAQADGVRNLKASLERVIASKKPDTMAIQKYDVRKPASEGGEFEERYWSPVNTPVLGPAGEVEYIIHSAEDVTGLVRLNKEGEAIRRQAGLTEEKLEINSHALMVANRKLEALYDQVKKSGEEKLKLLGAIVESSEDAILSKTLDGIISSWNTGAQKLYGYSADEAIGMNNMALIPQDKLQEEHDITRVLLEGKVVKHLETVRLTKSGKRLHISLSASPVHDSQGRIAGISKVARDITYRKEAEARLHSYMRDLERSNKDLDDFAYIASHDLKEPLRGLFNNAKFLQQDYKDKLDADGIAKLQRLGYLCQRMEQLVNDLLYFSRLGRQELAVHKTDMNMVVEDVKALIDDASVTIRVAQKLPEIICDRPRITEAVRNLVTNAIKYNDKREKIIEIGVKETVETPGGTEHHVFYVRDNGIGIEAEFFEEIFRIFKRLNEEEDDKKGTGVGLTFVRKIIERHGGRIWLNSEPGKGTTFYFTLKQLTH